MAITDWPAAERPREKLLKQGAEVLSDAELLAIFLRTGVKGKSAVDLARDLLTEFGSLRRIMKADLQQFCQGEGLGSAKFAQLQAVLEMSRRHFHEEMVKGDVLENPEVTRRFLQAKLRDYDHEVFAALLLDNKHQILSFKELFNGTLDGASVYPREVVKLVLQQNAAAVIFAHNHPSGMSSPSNADRQITGKLKEALALIDVRVLDHFIVGEDGGFSFAEHGFL
ncbi:MAG TPA: JAB domain-containing protein [Gammaproteobacteria bacterium]|nr:JAB domain-containing protein [Gammaproteobacteria bacterium]